MKHLSRSPLMWAGATVLSGLLYFFSFHFFPKTFPLIHLDITMDLKQALERADSIAATHNLGPVEHHNAAMFFTDSTVKTFVELEAGGKDAFVAMMEEKLYMPYTWRVRHFKEFEKNETSISFTPDGTPYGFVSMISENIPGAQLTESQACTIAETNAANNWRVNLQQYSLVESSQKAQPSTRIDHTFVYERNDKKIGEGLYRLKMVVSGDTLTELTPFVKVPEAFTRRYAEMRSANTTLAWAASLVILLLYFIGGCCLGLYWISRKRWLIIKQPLLWAIVLATASALASINQLPFLWMHYSTAQSSSGFLIQLFLGFFMHLIGQTLLLTIIIATAESLTRKAFGNHPQLWSLGSIHNAASYQVLGRTLGGYLMVGFNCAFVIAFYLLSTRYLQWWTPSEMLFDPNVLATYAPWFTPLAQSLNAGFMEECLFRAIPLAGAALLGTYCGKKNWWIGAAFILQAVVFGAAHANYPTQPSYARLIELLIPSLIWGATYLRWGLLPTIIAHCVYDIIWFSLPIFASHAPQSLFYKIIIIFLTLLPLLYVVYARIKKGIWSHVPESDINASWQPSAIITEEPEIITAPTHNRQLSSRAQKLFLGLGVLGLIAWLCTTPFVHDGITITIDRTAAIKKSDNFLHHNTITLAAPWKTLPLLFVHYKTVPQIAAQHKFIWQEGGKELYHAFLGTYLEPAHWTIRYAQFDTDIVQRAEEHKVMLYSDTILRYNHQLPESSAGAQLEQTQARVIAHNAIAQHYNLDPTQLTEISAEQGQLPNRRNWLFIFSDPAIYPLTTGQARISVLIAGDIIVDIARTIHVPEEWERTEQNKQQILSIVTITFSLIFLFFLILGAFFAFRKKIHYLFSRKLFFTIFGIMTFFGLIDSVNSWATIIGSFNTQTPYLNQVFLFLTVLAFGALIRSAILGLIVTFITLHNKHDRLPHNWITIGLGISTGLLVAGIMSIAQKLIPTNMPLWPQYDPLAGSLPLVTGVLSALGHYIQITISFSLLFLIVDSATQQWHKRRLFFGIVAALCGMSMIGLPTLELLLTWIAVGTGIGLILLALYRSIIRYEYSLIPLATASFTILPIIQQGIFNAYPGAAFEAIISTCVIGATSALWHWYMNRANQ